MVYSKIVMSQNVKKLMNFYSTTNTTVSFNLGRQYRQLLYAMIYAQLPGIGQTILDIYAGKQLSSAVTDV